MTQTFASFTARLLDGMARADFPSARSSLAEQETEFSALAFQLFALQFEHNPAYRTLCRSRNVDPGRLQHWTQIPPAPSVAFKELELTSLAPADRTTVFHSSGTTGHRPSRHFHDLTSLGVYEKSLLPWFRFHLLPEGSRGGDSGTRDFQFISLAPTREEAPHSSLVHMFDCVHRRWGAVDSFFAGESADGVWTLDRPKLVNALRGATRPIVLLGTAFTFVMLLDDLLLTSQRLSLPDGSRILETGGYKGRSRSLPKAELHGLLTDRLGVPPEWIVSEYGMSELSSQAYDIVVGAPGGAIPESRCFQFPPWARVQIISPESGRTVADGEAGLVRVFDLANVRSALAVQTEDLGVRCGDGFRLLGRFPRAEPRGCSLMAADAEHINEPGLPPR